MRARDEETETAATLSTPSGAEETYRARTGADGSAPRVLVLGATGYLGGRLVPRLLAAGYRVRALTRGATRLEGAPWRDDVDVVDGDATDPGALARALDGVDIIYYLIHSMSAGRDFAELDRRIARAVGAAAERAGVKQIIYLGGLHPRDVPLSPHLNSRREVGEILLAAETPTLVLQAGVVIGSGSASFEMIRHLTEVLPVMPAPRWVRNRIQPIAVRDVLHYLLAAAKLPEPVNRAVDIGGPDVLRYGQMMNAYAVVAGLPQRRIIALPVLTPRLASLWVGLVTPVPQRIARPLVESLQQECIMQDDVIDTLIPPPAAGLTTYRDAVRLALGRIEMDAVETSWVDGRVPRAPSDPMPSDPDWSGRTVFVDARERTTQASPSAVWRVISQIGGARGWYSASILWALRGVMDRLLGEWDSNEGDGRD